MVSFVCERCQSTMKKAKIQQHGYSCGGSYFSCVDCGGDFDHESVKAHNSCISEAEKHQGSMYKGPKKSQQNPRPPPGVSQPQGKGKSSSSATSAPNTSAVKPPKHYLDSTDDEADEPAKAVAPVQPPTKKQKTSESSLTPTASPTSSSSTTTTTSTAFDMTKSIRSLIEKKGSISLKKLRKGVIKAAGGEKDKVTQQLWETLLENGSEIKLNWSAANADDE